MKALDAFFESYYRLRPVNATFTGVHDYDDRLPDWSPEVSICRHGNEHAPLALRREGGSTLGDALAISIGSRSIARG